VAGLDCTARRNRERNGGHALVIWHVSDYDKIIVTEAVPTTNQFAADRFARLSSNGFNAVLRILHLCCP
jgi:hypothetical protein